MGFVGASGTFSAIQTGSDAPKLVDVGMRVFMLEVG